MLSIELESEPAADAQITVSADEQSEVVTPEAEAPEVAATDQPPADTEVETAAPASAEVEVMTAEPAAVPVCQQCGRTDNKPNAKFCGSCGSLLAPQESAVPNSVPADEVVAATPVKCPDCGLENEPETKFCADCGKRLGEEPVVIKTELAAELLVPQSPEDEAEIAYHSAVETPISVTADGAVDPGLPYADGGKDYQEDALLVKSVPYPNHNLSVHVLMVADGIGTPPAGEVFAELGVHSLWTGIRSPVVLPYAEQQPSMGRFAFGYILDQKLTEHLPGVIHGVEKQLYELRNFWNLETAEGMPSGTTIAMVVAICDLRKGHVVLHAYHHGNSRIMLVTGSQVSELSRISDHALPDGSLLSYFGSNIHPNGIPSGNLLRQEIWFGEADFDSLAVVLCTDGVEREFDALMPGLIDNANSAADFSAQAVEWAVNPANGKKAGLDNAATAAMIVRKQGTNGKKEQTEES